LTPRDYDVLRIDDCLFSETEVTATNEARFAFEILEELGERVIRDGLTDWYTYFLPDRSDAYWWETDPGEYVVDANSAEHEDYYVITSEAQPVYSRFRQEIDSTGKVFGNGTDTVTFRDSSDLYVKADIRLPINASAGSIAWLGTRSKPSITGVSLDQYQMELVQKSGDVTMLRVRTNTAMDKRVIYESPLEQTANRWHEFIIITLDDQIAFFADGRFITMLRGIDQFGGTIAFGVEANTIAHFDNVILRDTSVD
jgi:hypothetical protein